ncbi:MAG: 4Fe-4S binding protein, partial [Actinobacteria bacterium]|nr:4Fe-4S binding protein [Actinomycetota bacterium]
MKNKFNLLQLIRRITQIVFFVFFTGYFTLAFSGFKRAYLMLLHGNFSLDRLLLFFTPALTIIVLALILGRIFCGWFCAFGTLNSYIFMLSRKVFKIKFSISPAADSVLKYMKYGILAFIIYFAWTLNIFPANYYNPWDAFSQTGQDFQA